MSKWAYTLAGFAAPSGAAGVTEDAAAAHAIADPLLKLSGDFLIVNAAAVIAIGALALAGRHRWLLLGATILLAGSFLFCGEISAHVFLGRKFVPLAAPIGGALMIVGWLTAAAAAFAYMFRQTNRSG